MKTLKKISFAMLLAFSGLPMLMAQTVPLTNGASNDGNYLQNFYDEDTGKVKKKKISGPSAFWTTVKIIIYTGALGTGAYFLVKYIAKKGTIPTIDEANVIETLVSHPMGMGSSLLVAKVGQEYYLLSQSGEGLRLIDKITNQETIDAVELNKGKTQTPKETKFMDILTMFPGAKKLNRFDFLKNQKDRLKKL